MTSFAAHPHALAAPVVVSRSWKATIRRVFEMLGAQYAHSPYML